jgi:hypothetical protein
MKRVPDNAGIQPSRIVNIGRYGCVRCMRTRQECVKVEHGISLERRKSLVRVKVARGTLGEVERKEGSEVGLGGCRCEKFGRQRTHDGGGGTG